MFVLLVQTNQIVFDSLKICIVCLARVLRVAQFFFGYFAEFGTCL